MSKFEEFPTESESELVAALMRMEEIVVNAKAMPLSASVLVSRDEMLFLIDSAKQSLPGELREAAWIVRERSEYLNRVSLEAEEIIDEARARAERMVSKQEIVRQAQSNANRILVRAREDAARLRFDAEDYADQKLAELEIALSRVMKAVKGGRERLAVSTGSQEDQSISTDDIAENEEFVFDQDRD